MKKLLLVCAAALTFLTLGNGPAFADINYSDNWAGFRLDAETGTYGVAEGVYLKSNVGVWTSGCSSPNQDDYIWVGQGGVAAGKAFTQAGWGFVQGSDTLFAWYAEFDANGVYQGIHVQDAANITASMFDDISMREVWSSDHQTLWYSWRNITTNQYWSVELDNHGAYFNGRDGSEWVFEVALPDRNMVQVDQVDSPLAHTEQIVGAADHDSRGVPIQNGGTDSIANAQHKLVMQEYTNGNTRVAPLRTGSGEDWTATPQSC